VSSESKDLTAKLRAHAREAGADLLGIAPIDRFSDLPPEHHPASIFPEVRSVLVVGKRIPRGALRGVEEGTQFHLYLLYGRDWLNNRVLATATYRTAEWLEDAGWEAVPLPNLPPEIPPLGIQVREGTPAPNVMLDCADAAVRAGVGQWGWCGHLLTPQFGPRQRVQLILTDVPLDPDPLPEGDLCSGCAVRSAACPLGALGEEPCVRVAAGRKFEVAALDLAKCRTCQNGANPNNLHPSGQPDRLAALCARNCIVRLEQDKVIANRFEHPFRKRPPWGVVVEQRRL